MGYWLAYGSAEDAALEEASRRLKLRSTERFLRRGLTWATAAMGLTMVAMVATGGPPAVSGSSAMALDAEAQGGLRRAYYINCDGADDRRDLMEKWLGTWGVPHERVPCARGGSVAAVLASGGFAGKATRASRVASSTDDATKARTASTWLSHREAFAAVASLKDSDPDGLYLVLEDDAVPARGVTPAAIEAAARTLPENWSYASFNAHESVCAEDRVDGGDWFLKQAAANDTLYARGRLAAGCTLIHLDGEWGDAEILYLSASASLLRPRTADKVLAYLDAAPVYHVDALLRTPDAKTFASYQYKANLFGIAANVSETRRETTRKRRQR